MSSDTRDKILQVARRLFIRQGYTATSTRQIAAEAGIGKATIYHHFPDKQAIMLALFDQDTSHSREALEAVMTEAEPRRRIETAFTASLRFFYEAGDLLQIMRREVPGGQERLQTEYASFSREFGALLAEALQRGIEQGRFRAIDSAEGVRVLMAMIQGTFAAAYMAGERPRPPEKAVASLLDIFFHGIEKEPSAD